MSNHRSVSRSGGAAADENELQAKCSVDDESVYAGSSSGRGSKCDRSLSSSDGYLHSVDSCGGGQDGMHYEEVCDEWTWRLCLTAERHHHFGIYPKAVSGQCIQNESRWTTSSLLCGVSMLLTTCSLSSLAVCIALTGFSLIRIGTSRSAPGATGNDIERKDIIANDHRIDGWTEKLPLMSPTDQKSSHQNKLATTKYGAARYSWDCSAQAGLTKCRPVHKVRSQPGDTLSSLHQHGRASATFYVLVDGIYHLSIQMTGKVWLPPPTVLGTVVTRITPEFGSVNVTEASAITGAAGSGFMAATLRRGAFSVYTAAAVRLGAGDELLAHVVCVEDPNCVVHVNGTSSYLTL